MLASLHRRLAVLLCAMALAKICAAQAPTLVLTPGPLLSTIAGSPVTSPSLHAPSAMAYDSAGNLYVVDTRNHVVRSITPAGRLSMVAGTGQQGFAGDGSAASAAMLDSPLGIALTADGTMYIADTRNQRIRRVSVSGVITTVAGSGAAGFSGDGGPAVAAALRSPGAVLVNAAGELLIADTGNHRVRSVAADGTIRTIAGDGTEGSGGDGGPAIAAELDSPAGLALRPDGSLLIADRLNNRVRVVGADGVIQTLAAGSLPLRRPTGVAVNTAGETLIADSGNFVVRQVSSVSSGIALGSGEQGALQPTALPAQTPLGAAGGIAADSSGGFALSDRDHQQVQHLGLGTLQFADTPVGSMSPDLQAQLTNAGLQSFTVNSLTIAGAGYVIEASSGCGTPPFPLAPGASCSVRLAFAPAAEGLATATLTALAQAGVPQRLLLTGTGLKAGSALATSTTLAANGSIVYAGLPLVMSATVLTSGTAAATGQVTFTDGGTSLGLTPLTSGGAQFTTAALSAGLHSLGAAYSGDAKYLPSTSVPLAITVAPAPDFLWTAGAQRLALNAGSTGSMPLTLQPVNGSLNQPVAMQVSGLPAGATYTLTPTPVTLSGNPVTVVLAVTLPASASLPRLALVSLGMAGLLRRRQLRRAAILLAIFGGSLTLSGCGAYFPGSSSSATTTAQSGTHLYPVSVTATTNGVTGSPIVHVASFTLAVN